jgi:hypothetical protein
VPHAKAEFEFYTINMDLSGLNDVDLNEERSTRLYKMLNVGELDIFIDSIADDNKKVANTFGNNIYRRTGVNAFVNLKKQRRRIRLRLLKKPLKLKKIRLRSKKTLWWHL